MKKLIVLAIILLASTVQAQSWKTANQFTLGWDPVTVSFGDVVYEILLANYLTDPGKTNPAIVGENIAETRYKITLAVDGKYLAGVRTVRIVDGEVVGKSEIAWSDDPLSVMNGETFGLSYWLPPGQAKKLYVE